MIATQEQIKLVENLANRAEDCGQSDLLDHERVALRALLREREDLRGSLEEWKADFASLQRENERLTQCIRERDAARSAAVGDQRGHWCSAHGVYCAALSAKVELEAQLQAEREALRRLALFEQASAALALLAEPADKKGESDGR